MLGRPKEMEGVLLVDKPRDHTSHDVIARLRGKLKMKRVGHAGTLDPMATGLLVVLIGKATAFSQYLISLDKEYTATMKLGVVTNSQDADGEMLETKPVPPLTTEQVKAAMNTFLGDQYQTPPMFSAIKVNGVPLYKLGKGQSARIEYRAMDSAANPYLAFAVILAAGLKGIEGGYELPPEADGDVWSLTDSERRALGYDSLPASLDRALGLMEDSELVAETLGEQVFEYVVGHPLADLQMRQAEALVQRVALRLLDRDLELGAAVGGLFAKKFLDRHLKGHGERLEQGQLRLAPAVLQERQLRRRSADTFPQVREGVVANLTQMTKALTERHKV